MGRAVPRRIHGTNLGEHYPQPVVGATPEHTGITANRYVYIVSSRMRKRDMSVAVCCKRRRALAERAFGACGFSESLFRSSFHTHLRLGRAPRHCFYSISLLHSMACALRCSQHPSSPTMLRRSTVLLDESRAGEKTLGLLRARLQGSLRSCDVSEATCVQSYSHQCAAQPHCSPVYPATRSAIPSMLRYQVLTRNIFCPDVLLSLPDRRVSPPSVYCAVHTLSLILSSLRII